MLPGQNSNLALAQQALGQRNYKQALKHAKRAEKDAPNSPVPPNFVGIALSSSGRPGDAIKAFRRALRLNPAFDDARMNLAQTCLLVGQFDNAVTNLKRIQSPNAQVHYLLAQGYAGVGSKAEALRAATAFIDLLPKDKRGYKLRAHIELQFGLIPDAILDYEQALKIDPNDAETLTLVSLPLARHLRTDDALNAVARAVEIDPHNLPAQLRLAAQFSEVGERDKAIAQYRKVLGLWPGQSTALKNLCEALAEDELIAMEPSVQSAFAKVSKGSEDEASLSYAQAHILEAQSQTDQANQYYRKANAYYAKQSPYMVEAEEHLTDRILGMFPDAFTQAEVSEISPTPIFVVGLPRSGTTLVEAMLGNHAHVVPLGERGTLGFLLEETITKGLSLDAESVKGLRREDSRLMPSTPESTIAYIDKMPENYRLIGFLKTVYPESKIIHVRRDPRDIALSMFKAHFAGSALNYTYDLRSMGHRFNLYNRVMQHWGNVLPGQILDVHYEKLVADIMGEGRLVAEFCGLEWTEAMAHPDRTKAQVLTMSANQLRQPVHTNSVGKWQLHQELLKPFLDTLEYPHEVAND